MNFIYQPLSGISRRFLICSACARRAAAHGARWQSTDAAPPALMSKFKEDLKTAMRNKDKPRLNVLRAAITEVNNASKTSSPVTTDLQILALLKKRKAGAQAAQQEARDNNREDIAEKQQSEIDVLDEYAGSVKVMTEDEIKAAITSFVEDIKSASADTKAGQVLKEIFKPGGILDGKPVEKIQVVKVVNSILGGKP